MNLSEANWESADSQLILRAQAGGEEAMATLYRKYVQVIYRYIYFRVGDKAAADDLTSEVFLRALQAIGRYRERGKPLSAWLYRIARDRVTDHHRRHARRPIAPLSDDLVDAMPGPESAVLDRAETAALSAALARLTEDQQDVTYFRFTERLSLEETATATGKSVGAIKALQFRALNSLARLLK
jgi:RNA polymerase sigma-70 factor (ECF subfamily)